MLPFSNWKEIRIIGNIGFGNWQHFHIGNIYMCLCVVNIKPAEGVPRKLRGRKRELKHRR